MKKQILLLLALLLTACTPKEQTPEIEMRVQETPYVEEQENATDLQELKDDDKAVDMPEVLNNIKNEADPVLEELKPFMKNKYYKGKDKLIDYLKEQNEKELPTEHVYESYSQLDKLGRPGEAKALLHRSMMPTEKRQSIAHVKPVGFVNNKYDNVEGGWLYNRCHLIGFQLAGENDNEKNLITGTRQMNVDMIKWEKQIADFLKRSPNNYVEYTVTPVYENDDDLIAKKLIMKAIGYGDDALDFLVEVENKQDGIEIDYKTGKNWRK